jgi:APA family basic amino acid/polyamine antiporter
MERPYRVLGYPALPALYLLLASFIEVQLLRYKPQYTWPGLILILSGVPVYLLWRKSQRARSKINSETQI